MAVQADPARLVVSLLANDEARRQCAVERLAAVFGPLVRLSAPLPFGPSPYYEAEMGPGLDRRLAVFGRLVPLHGLAQAKRSCMVVEEQLARQGGRRTVNIDPGLLTAGALILATHKYQWHRQPLGDDLYCELTLFFRHGQYRPQDWTYADYADPLMRQLLGNVRQRYLWRLKQLTDSADGEMP